MSWSCLGLAGSLKGGEFLSLLEKINQMPPSRCRLLARKNHGRRLMSVSDLMSASGLSRKTVIRLSRLNRWDRVPLATAERFARACNVDLLAPWRRRDKRLIGDGRIELYKHLNPRQRVMVSNLLGSFRLSQHQNDEHLGARSRTLPESNGLISGCFAAA